MRNDIDKLKFILKDRDVLCIPIVSSINRKDGNYDLSSDGNINRIITTYWNIDNMKSLTIILPKHHIPGSEYMLEALQDHLSNDVCKLKYCENFGIHAGEQRKDPKVYRKLLEEINEEKINLDRNYVDDWISTYEITRPLVMFSSQYIGMALLNKYIPEEMIFWSEVCEIPSWNKTRSFLEGYDELNLQLVKNCKYTIVTSPNQYDYYNQFANSYKLFDKILYCPKMIDRNIKAFEYYKDENIEKCLQSINNMGLKIFYLPYRLTDEGYKIYEVVNFINNSSLDGKPEDCVILYTDPNNSGIMEDIKKKFGSNVKEVIKVSSERDVYYTILDSDIDIHIPYFEDLRFINHASIHEIIYHSSHNMVYLWKMYYPDSIQLPYNLNITRNVFYFNGKNISFV